MGITQNFEPVIGLEVHVELNTKTKMFCRCSADYFGKKPNTHTCPICLGLPGALPSINQQAIENCMKIGLALNCTINEESYFERKNYFYPDLAKGFQLSQLVLPIAIHGWIEVVDAKGQKSKIRINRAHQEEDTAKLVHQLGSQKSKVKSQNQGTLIDFNRSGVPLVEVVTEPDFHDSTQIKDYAKKLQQIFRYLGVSNADMEKGDMRLEANISVRPVGQKELPPYRVELKNINSFSFMAQAVEYEIQRQIESLKKGEKLVQETRGWDEDKKNTYIQRSKEEAHDYRYFPEPDLPELKIKNDELRIKSEIPELFTAKQNRFIKEYYLSDKEAVLLTEDLGGSILFEELVIAGKEEGVSPKEIANHLVNRDPQFLDKLARGEAKEIELFEVISNKKIGVISGDDELEKLAKEIISENPGFVDVYKKGKVTVIQALVGLVMRKSGGKADALKVRKILEKLLS